ncbi:GGDEF domain-containing protein [Hydrogenivirga sp. 128-5-R1-1]|uniref:GGDEF domain-containing protein n=1 Tax=Hydrogenivirga sp. 128-5-R1-1 TaxID=392423 RepID=UPI00015F3AA7|nr:GGDEF domain-containing protein [Hydrogenivirga sp. 128-5-R1-1]EDP74082.1 diguanylate cyclase (GGDEF domain) [Hydrogenivirga sp. 128-5-R1-1]
MKKIFIPLGVSLSIFLIGFVVFFLGKKDKENIIYENAVKITQSNYKSVKLGYKKLTDYFYYDVFDKRLLRLVYRKKSKTLKKILNKKFKKLYKQNIDKLVILNLNGKPVLILSKGNYRKFNPDYIDGQQLVYALKYKNKFLGNLYFSIPFWAIQKDLNYVFKDTYLFLLKKEVGLSRLKAGAIKSIIPSGLSDRYYYEDIQIKDIPITYINKKIRKKVLKFLGKDKPFSFIYNNEGNFYLITFIPVFNLNNHLMGYLVRYSKDNTYPIILKSFYTNITLSFLLAVILGFSVYIFLKDLEKFRYLSETDRLTGLYNKGKFNEVLQREIQRAKRYKRPLSLIIFDIDHFKKINDTYGHKVGDEVLKALAKLIKKNIRKTDFAARWGGEEFVILAPETNVEGAKKLAEKLRQAVETYKFPTVGKVTISLGVAQLEPDEKPEDFIVRADMALYKAKEGGRNRVEIAI